jgi:hypothetical protein
MRLGLWWPDHKAVTMIGAGKEVIQVNCSSSRLLFSPAGDFKMASSGWPSLVTQANLKSDISWIVPANAPSIGSLTVAQINEQLDALSPGRTRVTGNRANLWTLLQQKILYKDLE